MGFQTGELLKAQFCRILVLSIMQEIARAFVVGNFRYHSTKFYFSWCATPHARMGTMIKDSLELIYLAPWTVLLPGFAIIFTHFIKHYFYLTDCVKQSINITSNPWRC